MAAVRRFALAFGLVRANKAKGSVKTRRKKAGWNPNFLLEILQLKWPLTWIPCRAYRGSGYFAPLVMMPEPEVPRRIGEPEKCPPVTSPMRPESGTAHALSQGADVVSAHFIPVVSVAVCLGHGYRAEDGGGRQRHRSLCQHDFVLQICSFVKPSDNPDSGSKFCHDKFCVRISVR
jgi:hypothetical protein